MGLDCTAIDAPSSAAEHRRFVSTDPLRPEDTVTDRIARTDERLHLSIGAVCNNNCVFCMEEDRDGRYVNNSAMTRERVRWILERHRGAEGAGRS